MVITLVMIVGGLAAAALGSHFAISSAERLIAATGLSPFIVGLLLLALGTDLPEIANSLAAAAAGEGDIVVGNSVGSTFALSTLVLGLLPLLGGVFLSVAGRPRWSVGPRRWRCSSVRG